MEGCLDMASQIYTVEEIKNVVCEIAQRYGVERVVLFGSYAKGKAGPGSDIDLLIYKGRIRGLFQLSGFHLDLEEKLNTNVDVLTIDSLSDEFLQRINKEEVILYEQ